MPDHESNGNGEGSDGEHPLKLAVDINDWSQAGRRILKVVDGIGRIVPPADAGEAAQLGQLATRANGLVAEHFEVWETLIWPRLKKFEGAPIPPLMML